MTETIKYQSQNHLSQEAGLIVFSRRLVRSRRYGRLLSKVTQLGQVCTNVQANLASASTARILRRSR